MIYFANGQLTIRSMEPEDAQAITDAEIEQGWHVSVEKYEKRLEDQRLGKAVSLVAEHFGKPVGYIKIYSDHAKDPGGGFPGGHSFSDRCKRLRDRGI